MVRNAALGWKAHSGWAALVMLGMEERGEPYLIERRRVDLVDEGTAWAKQPYHAAAGLPAAEARAVVRRGVAAAERHAGAAIREAVERLRASGHEAVGCAVLVGAPMPPWSIEEVLAVHVRMHQAEGALFRDALLQAARACRVFKLAIPERSLMETAPKTLATTEATIGNRLRVLGKTAGAPWGKDQKEAALAAWMALVPLHAQRCYNVTRREDEAGHDP